MFNSDQKAGEVLRPKCGEIWMCNLVSKEGSVQRGYRPVFILSNDANNTYSPVLNVIPISTRKKRLPVHVELKNYKDYGLRAPSTMLVEQTTTTMAATLEKCVGAIKDDQTLLDICEAISIQFPILKMLTPAER